MKKRAAFLLALAAFVFSGAALAQSEWIADPESGCRVQNAHPVADESIRWSGECRNGFVEGRGTLQWFLKGQPTERTEGEWREGRLNGRALTTSADGRRHEGEFREGRPNGRGISTFPNGNRLDGTYRDGKANGRGVLTFANGEKLDAEFVDDQAVKGVWVYRNGNRYEGPLKDLQPHGRGVLVQPNGVSYEGEFKEGTWHGEAIVKFPNGDVYEGAWRGMMPNGRGTLFRRGTRSTGLWVDGCLTRANSDDGLWAVASTTPAACGFQ